MLVNKSAKVEINDIITIKLVSGEEVVGKLLDQRVDQYTIGKPIQITIQPVGPNQVGLAFTPLLGSNPEVPVIVVPVSALAIKPVKSGEDVTRNYLQATTGIITPTPQQTSILTP